MINYVAKRFLHVYSENARITSKRGNNKEICDRPKASSVTDVVTTFWSHSCLTNGTYLFYTFLLFSSTLDDIRVSAPEIANSVNQLFVYWIQQKCLRGLCGILSYKLCLQSADLSLIALTKRQHFPLKEQTTVCGLVFSFKAGVKGGLTWWEDPNI